jgi:hypothetical protein
MRAAPKGLGQLKCQTQRGQAKRAIDKPRVIHDLRRKDVRKFLTSPRREGSSAFSRLNGGSQIGRFSGDGGVRTEAIEIIRDPLRISCKRLQMCEGGLSSI